MKYTKYIKILPLVMLFACGIFIHHAQAASIYGEHAAGIGAHDVFVLELFLDTESATVNTIDGTIAFSDPGAQVEVRDLSVAGSAFTVWPRKPSLSEKGDVVSFVGGVPGGISGQHLSVCKIIISVTKESNLSVLGKNIVVYANDGKGTAVPLTMKFTTVSVGAAKSKPADLWKDIIANDNTPPEPFTITLEQDKALYDGKKFVTFSTTDIDSGIDFYEVREGASLPVRASGTYVLIDQEHKNDITVIAHDTAGNVRKAVLPLASNRIHWIRVGIWTLALFCVFKIKTIWRIVKNLFKKK